MKRGAEQSAQGEDGQESTYCQQLKPKPTMTFLGPMKGSETPADPAQLLQTQQESHTCKGEGADPAPWQSPSSIPILRGHPCLAPAPREGHPALKRPAQLQLIQNWQLEAAPAQPALVTQPSPSLVKPTPLPGIRLDRAGWTFSLHTNGTHRPEHIVSMWTNEFLTQTQESQITLGPRKERVWLLKKKKRKKHKETPTDTSKQTCCWQTLFGVLHNVFPRPPRK